MAKKIRENMVDAVMSLWKMGFDTRRMAKVLLEREDDCERWLHVALDRKWWEARRACTSS